MSKYRIIEANDEYALTRKRWFMPRQYYNTYGGYFDSQYRMSNGIFWHKNRSVLEKIIKRLEAK